MDVSVFVSSFLVSRNMYILKIRSFHFEVDLALCVDVVETAAFHN